MDIQSFHSMDTSSTSTFGLPMASCNFDSVLIQRTDATVSLHDLVHTPTKVEPLLDSLSLDQLHSLEQTLRKIKKRKARQEEANAQESSTPCNKKKKTNGPPSRAVAGPPRVEIRDGIEWVSFVYSHNRIINQYEIRTDIDNICVEDIDPSFRDENCVYPRAHVPRAAYQGNRWDYETQCNVLGWKLSWLNRDLVGKRGLIQRAVDSYRNRNPTMRSRRVTRQAKLLDGQTRKPEQQQQQQEMQNNDTNVLPKGKVAAATMHDDDQVAFQLNLALDQVDMDEMSESFRLTNALYPERVHQVADDEEYLTNVLGWKLAWLNPKLVNNPVLLQQALDVYNSSNQSPSMSCSSGTTESLDFEDCFSLQDDELFQGITSPSTSDHSSTSSTNKSISIPYSDDFCDQASTTTHSTTSSSPSMLPTPHTSPAMVIPSSCMDTFDIFESLLNDATVMPMVDPQPEVPSTVGLQYEGFDQDLLFKMEQNADLFNF
ncbi:hypothetical protein BC940DRAFT_333007 [Gongronella butleri]|nr:hypothetical protein BC940DRAFT_333007 [Gongronella butleri]